MTSTASRRARPTGRYFAPANATNCIETITTDYGDCGVRSFVVTGPTYRTADISIVKEIRLAGRQNVQLRIDMLNVFDAVNFTPVGRRGRDRTLSNYQLTGADSGRVIQLVARYNW